MSGDGDANEAGENTCPVCSPKRGDGVLCRNCLRSYERGAAPGRSYDLGVIRWAAKRAKDAERARWMARYSRWRGEA